MRTLKRTVLTAALAVGAAVVALPTTEASAADIHPDTVHSDRATVRNTPSGLVLANARQGDRVDRKAYCGEWVRVQVHPRDHGMAVKTGWTLRGDLTESRKQNGLAGVPKNCSPEDSWQQFVGAANAPKSSFQYADGSWHHVKYGTPIAPLSGLQCVPSYNYVRDRAGERPDPTQRVTNVDLAHPAYRYATVTGAVALVAVPRTDGHKGNIWAFVSSACVQPKRSAGYDTVYFPRVKQVDKYGCHGAVRSPVSSRLGWVWNPNPANRPPCPR
jgi:hypothetical protein